MYQRYKEEKWTGHSSSCGVKSALRGVDTREGDLTPRLALGPRLPGSKTWAATKSTESPGLAELSATAM